MCWMELGASTLASPRVSLKPARPLSTRSGHSPPNAVWRISSASRRVTGGQQVRGGLARDLPLGRCRAYNAATQSHEGDLLANERVERRLTAILAADVAGYSRLMGADEEGTLAQLKSCRRELVDPKIAEHRGRIVKTTGDGLLVEFASVVEALRCAVEMQRGMAERNVEVPADRRIEFRLGVNVGDIIVDGVDIFGDGVNIA